MAWKLTNGFLFNYKVVNFLRAMYNFNHEFPEKTVIVKDISRKSQIELTTALRYLDEFEALGFIKTEKSGRVKKCVLTEEGEKFYLELVELKNRVENPK